MVGLYVGMWDCTVVLLVVLLFVGGGACCVLLLYWIVPRWRWTRCPQSIKTYRQGAQSIALLQMYFLPYLL